MTLPSRLADALGADRVQVPTQPWTDIGGDDIGTPLCVVSATSTDDVIAAITLAREHNATVVPVGERTAYWSPIRLTNAIALDTGGLRGKTRCDDVITVGAGEPVRPLDAWLRSQGLALPVHPHSFGETSVGAMVATGLTSGIGMAQGGIDRWVTGLTVVTGKGSLLTTGTSAGFSNTPPFLRDGLPDPTGLFMGSEGTLGVITDVSIRVIPTPWMVHVQGHHTDPLALIRCGQSVCRAGLCDSFIILREHEPTDPTSSIPSQWTVKVAVNSSIGESDAHQRAVRVHDQLRIAGSSGITACAETPEERSGIHSGASPRWQGPLGSHTEFRNRDVLVGMDINVSYDHIEDLIEVANQQAADALLLSPSMIRTALYLAPGFVNMGLHTSVPRSESIERAHQHRRRWLTELTKHPIVPYRLGHAWPHEMKSKMDPQRLQLLTELKRLFDPDGTLNPDHPLVSQ